MVQWHDGEVMQWHDGVVVQWCGCMVVRWHGGVVVGSSDSQLRGYKSSCCHFSNCSLAECFPEKSRWLWNEHVCQEVKRTAL